VKCPKPVTIQYVLPAVSSLMKINDLNKHNLFAHAFSSPISESLAFLILVLYKLLNDWMNARMKSLLTVSTSFEIISMQKYRGDIHLEPASTKWFRKHF